MESLRKLTDEADLSIDLGFDDLDMVELAMDIEKEFSIDVTDNDIEEMAYLA